MYIPVYTKQALAPASAERRRWGRASFVDLYFTLFNTTTAPSAHSGGDSGGKGGGGTSPHRGGGGKEQQRMTTARLRNELHFALVAVNNCRCVCGGVRCVLHPLLLLLLALTTPSQHKAQHSHSLHPSIHIHI